MLKYYIKPVDAKAYFVPYPTPDSIKPMEFETGIVCSVCGGPDGKAGRKQFRIESFLQHHGISASDLEAMTYSERMLAIHRDHYSISSMRATLELRVAEDSDHYVSVDAMCDQCASIVKDGIERIVMDLRVRRAEQTGRLPDGQRI